MNSNTLKNIGVFVLVIVIAWLLFDKCGQRTEPKSANLQAVVDSLKAKIIDDSIRYATDQHLSELVQQGLQDDKDLLTSQILQNENRIRQLISSVRRDTNIILPDACPELADSAEVLLTQNKELREVNESIENNYQQQLGQADTALLNARERIRQALANFDACQAINAALRDNLKRSNTQIYAGLSGIYNPVTYGIGGSLMLKTKTDKLYGVSYYLTNGKPMYEARALFKISFRR
jgi:hypothetical protein